MMGSSVDRDELGTQPRQLLSDLRWIEHLDAASQSRELARHGGRAVPSHLDVDPAILGRGANA
jgi:hypothetical protein